MAKRIEKIKGKKGVTLVECVVAIAIFAIMSLLAYRGFTTGFNNIKKGEDNVAAANNATVVFAKAKNKDVINDALTAGSEPTKKTYQGDDLKTLTGKEMSGKLTIAESSLAMKNTAGDEIPNSTVKGLLLTYEENGYVFTEFLPYKKG